MDSLAYVHVVDSRNGTNEMVVLLICLLEYACAMLYQFPRPLQRMYSSPVPRVRNIHATLWIHGG